jgi:hypothetical protein
LPQDDEIRTTTVLLSFLMHFLHSPIPQLFYCTDVFIALFLEAQLTVIVKFGSRHSLTQQKLRLFSHEKNQHIIFPVEYMPNGVALHTLLSPSHCTRKASPAEQSMISKLLLVHNQTSASKGYHLKYLKCLYS